jgi:AcrR family transcriptional regulator
MPDPTPKLTETSRQALIGAAMRLFGRQGFKATTVRQIMAAAGGQNVALVSYYFGSKEGLCRACVEAVVEKVGRIIDPDAVPALPDSREAATQMLDGLLAGVLRFLVTDPASDDVVPFVLREVTEPGAHFDLIYRTMIEPRHAFLCRLWARATGADPDSVEARLAVFALVGQVIYFRIGRGIVARRMGWGPDEDMFAAVFPILQANLRAALAAHERPVT